MNRSLNAKVEEQLAAKDAEIAALQFRVAQLEAASIDENTVLSELTQLRRTVDVLVACTSTEGHWAQAH